MKIFETAVGGFLLGIWVASLAHVSISLVLLTFLFAVVAFLFWKRYREAFFALITIGLLFFSLGVLRYLITPVASDSALLSFVGREITATGLVVDEPDTRDKGVRLVIEINNVDGQKASGRVLVFTGLYPAYSYGDTISLDGTVTRPGRIEREGEIFAYDDYLAKDNIFFVSYNPHITAISTGGGNLIKRALFSIKRAFLDQVEAVIPEPESALAGGLVVGGKQALGGELLESFKRAGLIHMVVLSGYNLTIVADTLMRFLARIPQTLRLGTGAGAIILFTIMTGAGPATLRAAIMAIIVMLARHRGKTFNATRALLVAAFFMILFSPKALVFDRGFQLSFLATMGLVYIAPLISERLSKIPETIWKLPLRDVLASTIAAQIAVFPWLLYTTGDVSIVALLANVLVLPLVPVTMLLIAITGFVGFVAGVLSVPLGWLSYALLHYDIVVARLFASIPFGSLSVKIFPLWLALLIYFVLALSVMLIHRRDNSRTPVEARL